MEEIHREKGLIKLGPLRISGRLILAPVAGYTDSPYRSIARRHGAALTVTELISADGIVHGNQKTERLMRFTDEERPLALQIFGNDPAILAEAAEKAAERKPDLIDINMGCPSRKVCNSGAGAALLLDPDKAHAIASAVVRAVSLPVSVKIRTGWDDNNYTYREIAHALEAAGISLLFVHGRTRAQQYQGSADWDIMQEIRELVSIPVIGNGDIRSYAEAQSRLASSGCPAVMIGRGAIGNPWIFSGKQPSTGELIEEVKAHTDSMIDFYGDYGLFIMRKHFTRYFHGLKNVKKIRIALLKASTRAEVEAILDSVEEGEGAAWQRG